MIVYQFPVEESAAVWHGDGMESANQYVEFMQEFSCKEKNITLFLSCDSRAAVCIDGAAVGFALYDGTETTGIYEVFDLAPYLEGGEEKKHRLSVKVYYQGTDSNCYTAGKPYLIFGARLRSGEGYGRTVFYSGGGTLARRDLHYRTGPVESNQTGYVWHYDAAAEDTDWERIRLLPRGKSRYQRRPIPRQELLPRKPATCCAKGDLAGGEAYCLIFDLGEESSGFLELEVEAEAGSLIRIGWGEHLADRRVRSRIGTRCFECSYRCREGRQVFFHPFHRIGLRYLELQIFPGEGQKTKPGGKEKGVICRYAGIRPLIFPVRERGNFRCSSSLHQKIYETAVRTLRLCMHEHYEDCPWREQALYALDAASQMLCGYYCFGEYEFAAASLELLGMEMGEDGFLPLHVPGKDAVTIPCYTFMWVIAVRDYLMYAGDEAAVRRMWPNIRRAVFLRLAEEKEGLLAVPAGVEYWNYYEWSETLSGEPIYRQETLCERVDAPYIMAFVMMLEACAEIACFLREEEDEKTLKAAAARMRTAGHVLFWDASAGYYHTYAYKGAEGFRAERGPCAELVQAFALLSGTAEGKEKEMLLPKLAGGEKDVIPCTLAMKRYKYEALLEAGDEYAEVVFADIAGVWGGMLQAGATSFWETELGEADFDGAGSLCHGWSAIPIYFYYAYLLGIRPAAPGFVAVKKQSVVGSGKNGSLPKEAHGLVPVPGGAITV